MSLIDDIAALALGNQSTPPTSAETPPADVNPQPSGISPYDPVINQLGAGATRAYGKFGIDPVILLAIPVNETGINGAANPKNNPLYGIKCYDSSDPNCVQLPTWEMGPNGEHIPTTSGFQLGTAQQQIDAFITLVSTAPRYADAWANRNNPAVFLQKLKDAGYATDVDWPVKVMAIYNQILPRFTGGGGTPPASSLPPNVLQQISAATGIPVEQLISGGGSSGGGGGGGGGSSPKTGGTGGPGVNFYPGLYVPDITGNNILEVLINALKALIAPIVQIATFFRAGTTFLVWLANPINWARAILVAIGIALVGFGVFMLIRTF